MNRSGGIRGRDPANQSAHELHLLEQIERNPDATQADLATQLGVAVGTINWYVKRLVAKGYVKVTRMQRKRLRYLITPTGIREKTRLAVDYVRISMRLYRTTRLRVAGLLDEARRAGYHEVCIDSDGDLADVCRLTCQEHGVVVASVDSRDAPRLEIEGVSIRLRLPPTRGAD